jgi:hypothetical protein
MHTSKELHYSFLTDALYRLKSGEIMWDCIHCHSFMDMLKTASRSPALRALWPSVDKSFVNCDIAKLDLLRTLYDVAKLVRGAVPRPGKS